MTMLGDMSYIAGGTIRPHRFCKHGTTERTVLEADAGEVTIGISHGSKRFAPWSELDDGNHAVANESVGLHGEGEIAYLQIAGTVSYGDLLKSDADGCGVGSVADDEWYGAKAEQPGVADDVIKVRVKSGYLSGSGDD